MGARGAAQLAQPVCQAQGRPSSPSAAGDGGLLQDEKETEKRGIMGEMPSDPQNSKYPLRTKHALPASCSE